VWTVIYQAVLRLGERGVLAGFSVEILIRVVLFAVCHGHTWLKRKSRGGVCEKTSVFIIDEFGLKDYICPLCRVM